MENDGPLKDDDKLEFTPEGEALGYVSLDQAQVLALREASNDSGFYGLDYSGVELARDVISAEEGEDYYRIRLSFSPLTGFRGQAGAELFTIDKLGNVESRRILSFPQAGRGFPAIWVVLIAVGIGAGVLAVLFVTGVFSGSPSGSGTVLSNNLGSLPQSAQSPTTAGASNLVVSETLTPDAPATLQSLAGDIQVNVPAGAVSTESTL